MKVALCMLAILQGLAFASHAAPVAKLPNFELTDQNARTRIYKFPKSKATVMTVADHKGSGQLEPWIAAVYARYQKRIDIDGIADVSMIPKPFHVMFRKAFRKKLTYSVMLDWDGSVVKRFDYRKGVANVYLIDRQGRIVKHLTGPITDQKAKALFAAIDRME